MSKFPIPKPPLPVAQSFLTCYEILFSERRGKSVLMEPTAHVPMDEFPAQVQLAVFAEFTGGHGRYMPQMCLRDAQGQAVWNWIANDPFNHIDPLLPSEVTFNKLMIFVPHADRYTLVLMLNGEEVAQRTMWFGLAANFRNRDPA